MSWHTISSRTIKNQIFYFRLFLVFPWFISFYNCIPPLSSVATPFGNLGLGGLLAFSSKSLTYFAGFNLLIASNANLVTGIAGLVRNQREHLYVSTCAINPCSFRYPGP